MSVMEEFFKNKVIIITGGSRGIGLEIAKTFAEFGAKIAICARDSVSLASAGKFLRKIQTTVLCDVCDVSNYDEQRKFAYKVKDCLGCPDVWINNAGISPRGKLSDTEESTWNAIFDINVKSVFFAGQLVYELMKDNGGVMLNAASIAGYLPSVTSGVYAASKAAVISLTKSQAAELAPYGIRVCAYAPGLIETDMTKDSVNVSDGLVGVAHEKLTPIALRRYGKTREVANAVAFLASDYASYIVGSCIDVNGGKFCVQNAYKAWEM
jgi:NAD(P)-dependent dehydrogenase (short-subunit alcohol dehydrogenase family)